MAPAKEKSGSSTKKAGKDKATKTKKPRKPDPLFPARLKNYGIGNDIKPRPETAKVVKMSFHERIAHQKQILMKRLKIPPGVNQFNKYLDANAAAEAYKLLMKYCPETKAEKKRRLVQLAVDKIEGKDTPSPKPIFVKHGIRFVTTLIMSKKAKIVFIANNVDPLEIIVWMPALCRKMEIPYCIIKDTKRLGNVVHEKSATCLALTEVRPEDTGALERLSESFMTQFNRGFERKWGGGILSMKSQHKLQKRQRAIAVEQAKKAKL